VSAQGGTITATYTQIDATTVSYTLQGSIDKGIPAGTNSADVTPASSLYKIDRWKLFTAKSNSVGGDQTRQRINGVTTDFDATCLAGDHTLLNVVDMMNEDIPVSHSFGLDFFGLSSVDSSGPLGYIIDTSYAFGTPVTGSVEFGASLADMGLVLDSTCFVEWSDGSNTHRAEIIVSPYAPECTIAPNPLDNTVCIPSNCDPTSYDLGGLPIGKTIPGPETTATCTKLDCTGEVVCASATITGAWEEILCNGLQSCSFAMISGATDLVCKGDNACQGNGKSIKMTVNGKITCEGSNACSGVQMESDCLECLTADACYTTWNFPGSAPTETIGGVNYLGSCASTTPGPANPSPTASFWCWFLALLAQILNLFTFGVFALSLRC